ncbi:MAG: spore germination protein [Eubacteriales bacterium]
MSQPKQPEDFTGKCPHPRPKPTFDMELNDENIQLVFNDCADFLSRTLKIRGDPKRTLNIYFINGMVRGERANDYILKPLAEDPTLKDRPQETLFDYFVSGALYNLNTRRRTTMDEVAGDLATGWTVILQGEGEALSFFTATEEKRSVGEPSNEPALKGSRESFSESLLTNTAMVRRKLRAPHVKIRETVVGRQTLTPVDIVWIDGIAPTESVELVWTRLQEIDIDGVETTGSLEEYLVDTLDTAFPLMPYTQRPDRFCGGLMEGRVGLLAEGIPLGYLLPGTLEQFFRTGQDKSFGWMTASGLMCLRYLCMMVTLLVPALYIALVTFHPEAIPVELALSIVAAKQQVPFSTIFEVLILLLAFEVLQEAGLRLPSAIGSTVSILGGLVVGNAAVEAHIVSPAVLIAVAVAGIAGYVMPSQDFAAALRLWRFLLAVLASVGGLFGVVFGVALLVTHLSRLESFGTPYLAPFTVGAGQSRGKPDLMRYPLPKMKWRGSVVGLPNRRNQK